MIKSNKLIKTLKDSGINFFTGVPDSLFSELCISLEKQKNHISSTNEGSAVGAAIGYYLARKKLPLVYLQNSGLGNIINPLLSLAHKKIYNIPIFFIIGWRGEVLKNKQIKDEPQHKYQGLVTEKILKILQIKYVILNGKSNYEKVIKELTNHAIRSLQPVALLIRKNTFEKKKNIYNLSKKISRENALKIIINKTKKNSLFVSTTGVLSRELMEIKNQKNLKRNNMFYCVGGMGHAISVANGIAFANKNKKIICLDGDGAALMHLGAQVNSAKQKNLVHILINNNAHDSVGAQKTASHKIFFCEIAEKLKYNKIFLCNDEAEIENAVKYLNKSKKSVFIEIICKTGFNKDLARPNKPMEQYKKQFMKFLKV